MKRVVGVLCIIAIAAAISGCGKKIPLSEDQKIFAGVWLAANNSSVTIYLDGGGDMKTPNSSITGGTATITAEAITIGVGPIKTTLAITEKPKESGGKWVMVLNGITYTKN
jgi:hypothetical protein